MAIFKARLLPTLLLATALLPSGTYLPSPIVPGDCGRPAAGSNVPDPNHCSPPNYNNGVFYCNEGDDCPCYAYCFVDLCGNAACDQCSGAQCYPPPPPSLPPAPMSPALPPLAPLPLGVVYLPSFQWAQGDSRIAATASASACASACIALAACVAATYSQADGNCYQFDAADPATGRPGFSPEGPTSVSEAFFSFLICPRVVSETYCGSPLQPPPPHPPVPPPTPYVDYLPTPIVPGDCGRPAAGSNMPDPNHCSPPNYNNGIFYCDEGDDCPCYAYCFVDLCGNAACDQCSGAQCYPPPPPTAPPLSPKPPAPLPLPPSPREPSPAPSPPAACAASCEGLTCGEVYDFLSCEQSAERRCECVGCCAPASATPASPPAPAALHPSTFNQTATPSDSAPGVAAGASSAGVVLLVVAAYAWVRRRQRPPDALLLGRSSGGGSGGKSSLKRAITEIVMVEMGNANSLTASKLAADRFAADVRQLVTGRPAGPLHVP